MNYPVITTVQRSFLTRQMCFEKLSDVLNAELAKLALWFEVNKDFFNAEKNIYL